MQGMSSASSGPIHDFFTRLFTGKSYLAYLLFNLTYTFIAAMCVFIEPASAGGGISEIKCYLNGVNVPGYFSLKTLVCKIVGVTFAVSASFPVGKEGPMFHSGAIVAALVAQAKLWCIDISTFSELRNDQEKRDFVTCGAAAGVASAFASPIGGVLLSLEEGASFWSTKVTWRAFFCAMIALGTMLTISSLGINFGNTNIEQLFSFGEYGRET
jgi:H+/Cl- antiporter ClcA